MSVNVVCPNCSRKLRIEDDFVGKKVRCPDCKTVFVAEPPEAPEEAGITTSKRDKPAAPKKSGSGESGIETAPSGKKPKRKADEEFDDLEEIDTGDEDAVKKPQRLKPKEARAGWRGMQFALSLIIWGVQTHLTVIALLFVGLIFLMILGLIAAKSGGYGMFGVIGVLTIILYVLYALGSLAALILYAVGHGFFWQVPNQPGSFLRPMAIACMALFYAIILFTCGGYGGACVLSTIDGRLGSLLNLCSFGMLLLSTVGWFFVFWIFMRFICLEVRNQTTPRFPIYFMIVFPTYNFVGPILLVLLFMLAGASVAAVGFKNPSSIIAGGGAMFVVMAVAWLAFIIIDWCLLLWSSFILQNIRAAVEHEARR